MVVTRDILLKSKNLKYRVPNLQTYSNVFRFFKCSSFEIFLYAEIDSGIFRSLSYNAIGGIYLAVFLDYFFELLLHQSISTLKFETEKLKSNDFSSFSDNTVMMQILTVDQNKVRVWKKEWRRLLEMLDSYYTYLIEQ